MKSTDGRSMMLHLFLLTQTTRRCVILVLSRRKNETLVIGDNIRVTVVEIRGDKVRLAVSADRDVPVHREEVYEAIQREKQES